MNLALSLRLTLILSLSLPALSHAVVFRVENPCDLAHPILATRTQLSQATHVGDLTVQELKKNHIPFTGTSAGFNSISHSPVAGESVEMTQNNEVMLAFGMCYLVDGETTEKMPHEFALEAETNTDKKEQVVSWYLGYSTFHVKENAWVLQCAFASDLKDSQVVKKYCSH